MEARTLNDAEELESPGMFPALSSFAERIVDQLADSVLITDREGTIVYANRAFERISGYSASQVLGRKPRVLKSGSHPPETYEELWSVILAGEPFTTVLTNRRKNGDTYQEGLTISPIRDASGETRYFVSIGRDISARPDDELFTLLAERAPIGVYVLQGGRIVYSNNEFERYTGYGRDEVVGRAWWRLVLPEDRAAVRANAAAMLRGDASTPYEYRIVDKGGGVRWLRETVRSIRFRGERGVAGSLVDITDRKLTEQRLEQTLSLYAATMESTADGIATLDLSGRIVSCNQRYLDLWGAEPPVDGDPGPILEVMRRQVKDAESFRERVDAIWANQEEFHEVVELHDGRTFELYSRPQRIDGVAVGRVWSWRDITERTRLEHRLEQLASHDSLTALLNRRRLQESMELSLTAGGGDGQRGALLLLDIDQFKEINDTLGHQAGDEALFLLAVALQHAAPDGVVARYGGDEFAIFVPDAAAAKAKRTAERVLSTLARKPIAVRGQKLGITVSIGIGLFGGQDTTVADVLAHADLAMYEAKASGGNRYFVYTPRLLTRGRVQFRRNWQNRLREAVEEGRLRLYVQPVAALDDGALLHHELLVRFGGRFLSPRELRETEHAGLRLAVDRWLVREAVALLARLEETDTYVSLALNLSSWGADDQSALWLLDEAVREAGVDAGSLVLEVSDTRARGGAPKAAEALRSSRWRLCLSGLGDGTTSLGDLKHLAVDYVKVDGGFARKAAGSVADSLVASAVVSVAQGLGMETIAEGIHDDAGLLAARDLGIDYAQGPLVGRARPAVTLLRAAASSRAA